jgi:outer membrane biosynthesis protein TonB
MRKNSDDIKEYLRGDRRGIEAHRLEKKALSDPFLFEALEGLTQTPADPLDGIIRLERQLEERSSSPAAGSNKWWRHGIAAGILLAAGISLWTLAGREGDTTRTGVAELEQENAALLARGEEPPAREKEETAPLAGTSETPRAVIAVADIVYGVDDQEIAVQPEEPATPPATPPARSREQAAGTPPVASPGQTGKSVAEVDDNPEESVSMDVALLEDHRLVVKEVEAIAPPATRTGDTTARETPEQETPPHDIERDVSLFNRYVTSALQYPASAVKRSQEGKIYLSFEVSPGGALVNVRVISDFSSKECTKELSRLLQGSPAWKHSPVRQKLYCMALFEIGKEGKPHRVTLSHIASEEM